MIQRFFLCALSNLSIENSSEKDCLDNRTVSIFWNWMFLFIEHLIIYMLMIWILFWMFEIKDLDTFWFFAAQIWFCLFINLYDYRSLLSTFLSIIAHSLKWQLNCPMIETFFLLEFSIDKFQRAQRTNLCTNAFEKLR